MKAGAALDMPRCNGADVIVVSLHSVAASTWQRGWTTLGGSMGGEHHRPCTPLLVEASVLLGPGALWVSAETLIQWRPQAGKVWQDGELGFEKGRSEGGGYMSTEDRVSRTGCS